MRVHIKTVTSAFLLLLGYSIVGGHAAAQEPPSRPPRIAIGNFEYKGVTHLRDGTAPFVDMISTALIKTRKFQLVERNRVNEALKEMGLGEAGVVDPADCQKLGTLLKADLIMFGTITEASLDDKAVQVAGLSTGQESMRMAVDLRVIDAKTGEIKTAETISAKKTRAKGVVVDGTVATGEASSGVVGDVMREVANSIVEKLVSGMYPVMIDMVREDGQVRLNYGEPMVLPNTVYNVYDANGFQVGQIRVTEVQPRNAIGRVLSGDVQEGMICRKAQQSGRVETPVQEIPW